MLYMVVYVNSKVYHLVIEKCTTFQLFCKIRKNRINGQKNNTLFLHHQYTNNTLGFVSPCNTRSCGVMRIWAMGEEKF